MNQPASISSEKSGSAKIPSGKRLVSLDALRGFDMFWIAGGEEVVHGLYKGWPGLFKPLARQMNHTDWAGLTFYDLIFPLFVFIVGVSTVFSLTRMIEQQGKATAIKRIIIRSLILYVFGLLVYGGVSKGWDHVRWLGVLQRIAIAYFFTGLFFCFFQVRGLIGICAALLIGYAGLSASVPIRDFNLETGHLKSLGLTPESEETRRLFLATTNMVRGKYDDGLNLTQHIDYQYLPGHKWDGAYDPEGMLSTMGAVATCLLGVFVGLFLRNSALPDQQKVIRLLLAGVAAIIAGWLWGLQFPVIKKLWTSSYVLVAGGYACVFLAIFYQVIEIWNWRKWCTPFVWIGMNPITIYLIFHLLEPTNLVKRVVGGPIAGAFGAWGELLIASVTVGLMFALMRFLYERKIFLRL
jgi:predicted acyltransferase